jgi:ribosome maturation factor RimP
MNENNNNTNETIISMVSSIVEEHGCKIIDVDFENKVLNLDGPDDAVADCARALAELFD